MGLIQIEKFNMYYKTEGSGDSAIILLHGLGGNHTQMDPLFNYFKKDYRVISVDIRGHGKSQLSSPSQNPSNKDTFTDTYSIHQVSKDIALLCDQLDLASVSLISHSIGGAIALDLASRLSDRIASLVLMDTPLFFTPESRQLMQDTVPLFQGPEFSKTLSQFVKSNFFPPTSDQGPHELLEVIVESLLNFPPHIWTSYFNDFANFDPTKLASSCKAPVLYIQSLAPCDLGLLKNHFPNLTTQKFDGLSHFLHMEAPEKMNSAIDEFFKTQNFHPLADECGTANSVNHYLENHKDRQIDLFDLLATRVPLVRLATQVANDKLLEAMQGCTQVVLVEVGIGTGRQTLELLRSLTKQKNIPNSIVIFAIDPAQKSLLEAEEKITLESQRLHLNVVFHSINKGIEELTAADLNRIRSCGTEIFINSAFALHHVPSEVKSRENLDSKDHVLYALRTLNPKIFVLSEPDSDHETNDWVLRSQNCRKHFGLVFDLLDTCALNEKEKTSLKDQFFNREIQDILQVNNSLRTERHESAKNWKTRLLRSGFQIPQHPVNSGIAKQDLVTVQNRDGFIGLDFKGETIVAIFSAVS